MERWTVLISVGHKKSPLRFSVSKRLLKGTGWVILFILTLSLVCGMQAFHTKQLLTRYLKELAHQRHLLARLQMIKDKTEEVKQELRSLVWRDKILRLTHSIEQIPDAVRKMGVGGPRYFKANIPDSYLAKEVEETFESLDLIDRELRLEEGSFEEIDKGIRKKLHKILHTPSIPPTYGRITSKFGYRIHPIHKKREFHKGIDIANRPGTPVVATADGKVIYAGWVKGFGKFVLIQHGYGYTTAYGHLKNITVRKGQYVKRGQLIGTMGRTGLATGTHLHYEVRVVNKPVNPLKYADFSSVMF